MTEGSVEHAYDVESWCDEAVEAGNLYFQL